MDVFRKSWNHLLALTILLAITGCASGYREPAIPRTQAATINATSPVWIVTIDGKKVSRAGLFSGHKQFRVSPGFHIVEVQYSQISQPFDETHNGNLYTSRNSAVSEKNFPIRFLATSGTTYFVNARRSGDTWSPIITDIPDPTH